MIIDEARDTFRDYVRKKGLRNTRQRDEILRAFLSEGKHITIDDLYAIVKKENPEIGYATVHRNLKLMCECGLADEIKVGNKKTRYEQKLGHAHHDHLICLKCGKFIEVKDEKIERLQDKLAEGKGFIPMRHKLEIYGVCKKCK
ncbi:MAG TPA: transcriptional repressor [Thermodesulfovibrionales bacterium]|nr:transcriptional repressor [Thermodesulfovibrionales bacterium]